MAASEKIQPSAGLDVTSLINMFIGGKTGATSSSTTKANISAEGIDAMVKKILSSDSGLASIAQGERKAGLYDSTVNQQLVTNLVTQTAGELASRMAGTTTTQTGSQSTAPKIDPLKAGGALALYSFLSPSINEITGGAGIPGAISNAGQSLADIIFGSNQKFSEAQLQQDEEIDNNFWSQWLKDDTGGQIDWGPGDW